MIEEEILLSIDPSYKSCERCKKLFKTLNNPRYNLGAFCLLCTYWASNIMEEIHEQKITHEEIEKSYGNLYTITINRYTPCVFVKKNEP